MTTSYRPSSGKRSHDSRARIHSTSRNETIEDPKEPMKRKAQLTDEEERAKEKAMDFYRYVGKSEVEADRLACEDIKKEFSRLKEIEIRPVTE
jgi:hypothetical protein